MPSNPTVAVFGAVINCAGPFAATATAVIDAALRALAHPGTPHGGTLVSGSLTD
jgi:hypothetical protein